MKILSIVAAIAALTLSSASYAADKANTPKENFGNLAIVSDVEYSIEKETTVIESGLEYANKGLTLSLLPSYDWDKEEVSNVEIAASYDISVTDQITISPYGEYHTDKDFETSDKIIGFKTKIKLF